MMSVSRKSVKIAMIMVGALLVLVLLVLFILGWIASSKIIAITHQQVAYDQTVQSVSGNTYTILGGAYNVDGLVGGIRSDGSFMGTFSKPSGIDASTKTSVRTLGAPVGAPPKAGDKLSLQGNIWTSNPKEALGVDYQDVTYESPAGVMSAWLVNGTDAATWTIGVHGIGADKTEMLRFIKPVHDAGNCMLVINYRNDVSNPASPDGRNNLGNTEWQDVEAAVTYARSHGATKVNLYGDSLGGSLVESYLRRTKDTNGINRVVLDSPALDWEQILKHRAQGSGYPTVIYYPTAWILRLRAGINIARISTHPDDIKQKTLIIHSADDPNVPQAASKTLAAKRPDMVTFVDLGGGGHLRSWNYDQARYEAAVRNFIKD